MGIDQFTDSSGTPTPHYISTSIEDAFLPSAPAQWLASTYPRRVASTTAVALGGTTGQHVFQTIYLKAGWNVQKIHFMSGSTTALAAGTHQYFILADKNLTQLATTHNDTSTAWPTQTVKSLNIEAVAAGSASVYTVPSSDYYYLGYAIVAGTLPTGTHNSGLTSQVSALAPVLVGTSDVILTGPPAFPKQYCALTGIAKILYGGVS